jgi:sugar lactone lactonase YvrE
VFKLLLLGALLVNSSTPRSKIRIGELPDSLRAQAAEIQAVWTLYPDNACILYQVAALYAKAGHTAQALSTLREMAGKHAGLDPRLRDGFQNLASNPEFLRLKQEIRRENPPVIRAKPAFTIAEADLIPEGIAWSGKQQRFYLGSVKRKIVEVDGEGHARDFVTPADAGLGVVVGLRVDDRRGELWAVSEQMSPQAGLVRGIFRYRLCDGRLLGKYPVSGNADLLNDLVVTADGAVYATVTNSGALLWIAPGASAPEIFLPQHSLPDPNGITASPDGRFLFVAGWYGITRVDLRSRQTLLLKSSARISVGCIDGLYEHDGDLVGIQNCVHDSGRVLRMHLNTARDAVLAAEVLEAYNPLFEGITTGAMRGEGFYFMANTQFRKMGPGGSTPADVKFDPIHVLRLDLRPDHR